MPDAEEQQSQQEEHHKVELSTPPHARPPLLTLCDRRALLHHDWSLLYPRGTAVSGFTHRGDVRHDSCRAAMAQTLAHCGASLPGALTSKAPRPPRSPGYQPRLTLFAEDG